MDTKMERDMGKEIMTLHCKADVGAAVAALENRKKQFINEKIQNEIVILISIILLWDKLLSHMERSGERRKMRGYESKIVIKYMKLKAEYEALVKEIHVDNSGVILRTLPKSSKALTKEEVMIALLNNINYIENRICELDLTLAEVRRFKLMHKIGELDRIIEKVDEVCYELGWGWGKYQYDYEGPYYGDAY